MYITVVIFPLINNNKDYLFYTVKILLEYFNNVKIHFFLNLILFLFLYFYDFPFYFLY